MLGDYRKTRFLTYLFISKVLDLLKWTGQQSVVFARAFATTSQQDSSIMEDLRLGGAAILFCAGAPWDVIFVIDRDDSVSCWDTKIKKAPAARYTLEFHWPVSCRVMFRPLFSTYHFCRDIDSSIYPRRLRYLRCGHFLFGSLAHCSIVLDFEETIDVGKATDPCQSSLKS